VPVRREFNYRFGGGYLIRIDKEVSLRAMICPVANIARIQAFCDIRYVFFMEYRITIAFPRHVVYINPPRVLEENTFFPENVISDEWSSRTPSWGGNCCKGGFNDEVVRFFTARDGDDQKLLCLSSV
jgi:hypothetical protein